MLILIICCIWPMSNKNVASLIKVNKLLTCVIETQLRELSRGVIRHTKCLPVMNIIRTCLCFTYYVCIFRCLVLNYSARMLNIVKLFYSTLIAP